MKSVEVGTCCIYIRLHFDMRFHQWQVSGDARSDTEEATSQEEEERPENKSHHNGVPNDLKKKQ